VTYIEGPSQATLRQAPVNSAVSMPALEEMSPTLDELSLRFAIWAREFPRECLDIGCGHGVAAAAALARGGRVLAVDPDPAALHELYSRIPSEQLARLQMRLGKLPDLDFKTPDFGAVLAARVFHLLETADFQLSLRKFFRWLQPGGKVFISTLTPAGAFWEPFAKDFMKRVARDALWPGYLEEVGRYAPHAAVRGPIHLIDGPVLDRELRLAGFVVEAIDNYPLPWDEDQVCCAAIARREV